jgi:hypothetical protein
MFREVRYFGKRATTEIVMELADLSVEEKAEPPANESLGRPLILISAVFVGMSVLLLLLILDLTVAKVC